MSDTALLVIDAQESFRHRPYWSNVGVSEYVLAQQKLIDGCAVRKVPVVRIFHVEDQGHFSLASGLVETLAELRFDSELTVHKTVHSALEGSQLKAWLTGHGIRRLIVSGIRTEQCCETTTRHAFDSGYEVDYVTEATLTWAMKHPRTGKSFSADDIKERTELVLDGRFARVTNVQGALAAIDERRQKAA